MRGRVVIGATVPARAISAGRATIGAACRGWWRATHPVRAVGRAVLARARPTGLVVVLVPLRLGQRLVLREAMTLWPYGPTRALPALAGRRGTGQPELPAPASPGGGFGRAAGPAAGRIDVCYQTRSSSPLTSAI